MKKVSVIVLVVAMTLLLIACGGKKYEWPDSGISSLLPQPDSSNGEILNDDAESFEITVTGVSSDQYEAYIERCQEKGFTVDSETNSFSYEAYNEEGYKLSLFYDKSDESMDITLEIPRTFGEYRWPDSEIARLLPVPKSNTGSIEWERSDGFLLYVSNTPIEDYTDYVDQCAGKGFDVDYDKGDKFYYALNAEGYSITLSYEGYNVMYLRIEKPDEAVGEQSEQDTSDTEKPEDMEGTENTANQGDDESPENSAGSEEYVDGMRLTFKEAMDSYEAFFDEYCEFMEKYSDAADTSGMLTDYLEYMEKYADAMEKLGKIGEKDLNSEELKYYTEVMGRINQKLLDAAL